MPNKRIDQLNPNLNPLTGNELIPIFDISKSNTERITLDTLANYIDSNRDTYVTGFTYNSANILTISQSGGYPDISTVIDIVTGLTVNGVFSATTLYGDGSNLVGISNTFLTGATFESLNDNLSLTDNDGGNFNVTIPRYNRCFIPYGQNYTIESNFQSFIYGDLLVEGTLNLEENSQLVIINGNIILSGGTIIGSGTTYIVDLPETDLHVTSGTFNPISKQITFNGNLGFVPFNVDLSSLSTENFYLTAGTYNTITKNIDFTGNDVVTDFSVDVSQLLDDTNTYTTGATLNGTIVEFSRNDISNAYSVDLSTLEFTGNTSGSCIGDLWISNLHGCSPITIHNSIQHNTSTASGLLSTAFGYQTTANGDYSHTEGVRTYSTNYSHAEGYETSSTGFYSHSEGQNTTSNGSSAHAEGLFTQANGNASHAEGYTTTAIGNYSHAEGYTTKAIGDYSHAEGYNTKATAQSAHAEGNGTSASGLYSHAEGRLTKATGIASHTEGISTTASGNYSHAEGFGSTASADYGSHAEGTNTTASGLGSHAEGGNTVSTGNYSHAEGNLTLASGPISHAEGGNTTASGYYSHAEGYLTLASGLTSHAEGSSTTATGNYSHAGGYNSSASGLNSFIHSYNSTVTGDRSVVLGGQNLFGSSNDTVYVPNFNSRGNSIFSGTTTDVVKIYGSGTTSPIFSIQGSSGELFSVTDNLIGSLFSVNDISGLPVLEVFSDNTVLMGSYQAPSLNTTVRKTLSSGDNIVYSIPTSAYTGAFFDYTLMSSTGARAGNVMAIWSGVTSQYTDVSTNDIGDTTGVIFSVSVSGGSAIFSSSANTSGWTLKTIVRSI